MPDLLSHTDPDVDSARLPLVASPDCGAVQTHEVVRLASEGLSAADIHDGRRLIAGNPRFGSPYFSPGFLQAVARARLDTELLIGRRHGRAVLFLPYHRLDDNSAVPVGGALDDYHGIIANEADSPGVQQLLKQARLERFDFHSWWQANDDVRHWAWCDSIPETAAEWGQDVDQYLESLFRNSVTIRRQRQKTRKLDRLAGPLRFEFHDPDPSSLQWLIDHKRAKYRRTGCTDFFEPEWTRQLLTNLYASETAGCRGVLSVLYAGDQRVAAHFGIASRRVLHCWFPVFDREFHACSPGTELYLQVVLAAAATGVERVDFGYGDEPFKLRLANRLGRLACGRVGGPGWLWQLDRLKDTTLRRVRRSRYRILIRDTVRRFAPSAGKPVVQ
jgi:CelD/BcsL family acetyltransferase involved in cellulose biosynthesis